MPPDLTPENAADESILIEADADGLVTMAPNAQVVANAALGAGWYSAVVEVTSDFEAIAPAATDRGPQRDRRLVDRHRQRVAGGAGPGPLRQYLQPRRSGHRGQHHDPRFRDRGTDQQIPGHSGRGPDPGRAGCAGHDHRSAIDLVLPCARAPGGDPVPDEVKGENDNWEEAARCGRAQGGDGPGGGFQLQRRQRRMRPCWPRTCCRAPTPCRYPG